MGLTQLTDYAMRLLIYLAQQPHTLADILPAAPDASATHVVRVKRPARARTS